MFPTLSKVECSYEAFPKPKRVVNSILCFLKVQLMPLQFYERPTLLLEQLFFIKAKIPLWISKAGYLYNIVFCKN